MKLSALVYDRTRICRRTCMGVLVILSGARAVTAETVHLISERFEDGLAETRGWHSASNSLEDWSGATGAAIRGLATTYDDDLNPLTAQVPIPGGLELLDVQSPNTVWASTTLPSALDFKQPGVLRLFSANRIYAGLGGRMGMAGMSVVNATDNTILSAIMTQLVLDPVGDPNTSWGFYEYEVGFSATDVGDTLELRFYEYADEPNATIRGMEIADVSFSATILPEPATLMLLAVGGLMLARRRQ